MTVRALVLVVAVAASASASPLPWEVWEDLRGLAVLHDGARVLERSSHCPWGCRYDRHSAGDWRYIRRVDGEGVIFEEQGAGAITRIWMTTGFGVSEPLDPNVRIRVFLDGAPTPALDLPLPALFDGSTPPFVPPMVGDRLASSGGNFSYVPIPYRDGCRVTLVGADETRLWYQLTFWRLASADGVVTFTGAEDLSAWAELLGSAGGDPWSAGEGLPPSAETVGGTVSLAPGQRARLVDLAGPDVLAGLWLQLPSAEWSLVDVELVFDGEVLAAMPASDLFAAGRGGLTSTRSVMVGVAADGSLYCHFPMPFDTSAEVALVHRGAPGSTVVPVDWSVRRLGEPAPPGSGRFLAQLHVDHETPIGVDVPLVELAGRGRWVGLFADLGSVDTPSRGYLEGDERVYLDGAWHPGLYGTGTEDLFNGGFYFDQGELRQALHGAPYHLTGGGEDATGMYRLMLSDPVSFAHGLRAGLEGGPEGDRSLRARTVAWAYQRSEPALWRWDVLDMGSPASRAAHDHQAAGAQLYATVSGSFEGEPPRALEATGLYRTPGVAQFTMAVAPEAARLRLRRRLDALIGGQEAEVWLDGVLAGRFPYEVANPDRRWREVDLDLPAGHVAPDSHSVEVTVIALPNPDLPAGTVSFTAFRWELWCGTDAMLFVDGFEAGDVASWGVSSGGDR